MSYWKKKGTFYHSQSLLWTKPIHPSSLFFYTYVIRQGANRRIPIYFYSPLQVLYGHGVTEEWRKRIRSQIPLASLRCSHVLLFEGMFKILFLLNIRVTSMPIVRSFLKDEKKGFQPSLRSMEDSKNNAQN